MMRTPSMVDSRRPLIKQRKIWMLLRQQKTKLRRSSMIVLSKIKMLAVKIMHCKAADTQYKKDQGDYTAKKKSYDDAKKLSDASDVLLKKAQKDKTDADNKRAKD